jgi:DNA-binding SARP family transcriptional activator/tetratricopeptide (TPR) repeat protein
MRRRRRSSGALFVNILGGLRVAAPRAGDVVILERRKTRALLAMLALQPGRLMPRGRLMAQLWSSQTEDTARHGLRQSLFELRGALAKVDVDAIYAENDGIGLDASRVVVDAVRFEKLIGRGTIVALNEAISLYQGDLLDGFRVEEPAFEEWLRAERERLRARAVDAMKKLLAEHVRTRATDAAIHVAVRLLTFEPFDERVHRALMQLYADSGRPSSALRQYELCVDVLRRELGVEPETETRELYRRLLFERGKRLKAPVRPDHAKPRAHMIRSRGASLSRPMTPLIGRLGDLKWFNALWKRACQGQPQLGLVLGEAGIGKTRLVAELASRDDYRHADFLIGRGREGEDVLAFSPWVEALRPVLDQELVAGLTPVTRADLARLFPELADSALPPSVTEDGPRIFEAVANLLRLLSADKPVIVVIEDLHWCDEMTVRLMRFLTRRLGGRPVVLLGTARPEELSTASGRSVVLEALRGDESCASSVLSPSPRDEALELFLTLLSARDNEESTPLAERVWKLSEGNPFVVVECARAVRERGTASAAGLLELPDEVRALTARQLARLSEGATRLADAAAVIGRDFDVSLLAHATNLTPLQLADGLEELVLRQVLRELEGRFDFRHDRIREATYAHLIGPRRSLLHLQVAQALEAIYAKDLDPHCAVVGAHYRHAGVWPKASDYLARAGLQAWNRGAGREALTCFEDALQALAQIPDSTEHSELRLRLHLVANGASVATSSYERGRQHLRQAERLVGQLGDRRWQGRVAAVLSNSYRPAGELQRARRLAETVLEIARETEDRWLESVGRLLVGQIDYNSGNYRCALEHLGAALTADTSDRDFLGPFFPAIERPAPMRAYTRFFLVYVCAQLGELDMAKRLVDESFQESDVEGDPLGTLRIPAYMSLGRVHYGYGDFDASVTAYEHAVALYREDCHRPWYRPLSWDLALSYALNGRASDGIRVLEQYDTTERALGSSAFRDTYLVHLARVLLEAGRLDDAARTCDEALTVSRKIGARGSEAATYALLAEVAALRSPRSDDIAERHLRTALRLAEELEMRPLVARCHQRLAWLSERKGDEAGQRRNSAIAQSLREEMGIVDLAAAGMH